HTSGHGHQPPSVELHPCDSAGSSTHGRIPPERKRGRDDRTGRDSRGRPLYSLPSAMPRALVLNATDQPLAVVPARRAVVLVLKEKAEILATNGVVFRSERLELPAPAVVRLRYFVRLPYRPHAALTRRAVFARDGRAC